MFSLPRTPFEKFWDSVIKVFSPKARPTTIESSKQDYPLSKEDILIYEEELQDNRNNIRIEGRENHYHRPL